MELVDTLIFLALICCSRFLLAIFFHDPEVLFDEGCLFVILLNSFYSADGVVYIKMVCDTSNQWNIDQQVSFSCETSLLFAQYLEVFNFHNTLTLLC